MPSALDYKEILSRPTFRTFIAETIESGVFIPDVFEACLKLMLTDNDEVIVYQAATVCLKSSAKRPGLIAGKEIALIDFAIRQSHTGIKRSVMSMLLNAEIPQPFPIDFLNFCFDRMFAADEAVAVQALCIKMAYRLCRIEHELLPELKLYLEHVEKEYLTPAVKACVKNTLKKMSQMN